MPRTRRRWARAAGRGEGGFLAPGMCTPVADLGYPTVLPCQLGRKTYSRCDDKADGGYTPIAVFFFLISTQKQIWLVQSGSAALQLHNDVGSATAPAGMPQSPKYKSTSPGSASRDHSHASADTKKPKAIPTESARACHVSRWYHDASASWVLDQVPPRACSRTNRALPASNSIAEIF